VECSASATSTSASRPLAAESLLSTIVAAMRARQRQFVMRDQHAELDTQRTRLKTLLENLPIGVAFLDSQGASVVTNPAFMRFAMSGKSPASMSMLNATGKLRTRMARRCRGTNFRARER
jgi:nitrogen fixation/metabolism regulation signal transduction histidine kinase